MSSESHCGPCAVLIFHNLIPHFCFNYSCLHLAFVFSVKNWKTKKKNRTCCFELQKNLTKFPSICRYGLGWRGGKWYANKKFKREQMKLLGQVNPRRWPLRLPLSRLKLQGSAAKAPETPA